MLFSSVRHKLGTITMLIWISIINIFYTLVSSRTLDIYVYIYILHITQYNYVNEIYNHLYMLKKQGIREFYYTDFARLLYLQHVFQNQRYISPKDLVADLVVFINQNQDAVCTCIGVFRVKLTVLKCKTV